MPPREPGSQQADARRHYEEGMAQLSAGNEPAARGAFLQAVALDDSLATAHYQLGNCLRRSGEPAAAEQSLKTAISRDTTLSEAYISLAYLYRSQGQRDAAAATLQALVMSQPDPALHQPIAELLTEMGCHAQAASLYEDCLRRQPHDNQAYLKLGQCYQKLGRFEDAAQAFQSAIEAAPDSDAAYLLLAHTRRISPQDTALLTRFEAALRKASLSEETRKCLHFGLGKLYDDLGSYEQAFEHFRTANSLQHAKVRFDRPALSDYVESVKKTFTRELFRNRPAPQVAGPMPVFIVGMLRSGTTLVERILASHPRVFGLGETELVDRLAQHLSTRMQMPYPACVAKMDVATAQHSGFEFRRQWPVEAQSSRWVVDKNPLNFLHLGLIALMFPGAPLLHCTRDPMDTCLSIYFQYFAHTRNSYAYDLEDIAFFYKQYTMLMAHWRAVLPAPPHEVHYEELALAPEKTSRALVAAAGLEWHPDCLEPHKHAASISTASLWQARQPIYRDSVGRWRHYARQLDVLRKALEA